MIFGSKFQPHKDSPNWFLHNINQPGESIITVCGAREIHALAWNHERDDLPTLIFVHGFGAHAYWWSYLAPYFIDRYRVYALDMPGFGNSKAPDKYDENCFAQAIIDFVELNCPNEICLIGHSYGGAQSLRAMALAPKLFNRGIVVDSNIWLPPEPPIRKLNPKGAHKFSSSREECMTRFKLMPPQPNYIPALVHYIGFHSCINGEHGWHWKSDPNVINSAEIEDPEILGSVTCKVDLIYGENSFLNKNNKPQRVLDCLARPGKLVIIPNAGHHLMVDHPLQLVDSINSLLDN